MLGKRRGALISILLAFSSLAGIGLALSLAVHIAALSNISLFGGAAFVLHVGIFVVWFPTVIIAQRHTRDFKQKNVWRAALRGCPAWMKQLTFGFFIYAIVNFVYFFITTAVTSSKHSGPPDTATLRGFSGHWMAFYSAAMSVLYSSTRIPSMDAGRQCAQGHQVGPLSKFCERCGSPVIGSPPIPPAV
jgi:hypothetical protein